MTLIVFPEISVFTSDSIKLKAYRFELHLERESEVSFVIISTLRD